MLWQVSTLDRVRQCGRCSVQVGGTVSLRLQEGRSSLAGVFRCGSVWACPACNAKIAFARAVEVRAAQTAARSRGWQLALLTFTIRHDVGQRLDDLWKRGKRVAWKRATNGRAWARDREHHGIEGMVIDTEVTYGSNGWHVHVHALAFLSAPATDASVEALGRSMWERWDRGLVAGGFSSLAVGQDARLIGDDGDAAVAQYLAKTAPRVDLELTHSQTKGDGRTVPVWSLLEDVRQDGDADALRLWREYEAASFRQQQLRWSPGLKQLLGVGERTDEEIADEEHGTSADDVAVIEAPGWAWLVAHVSELVAMLDVAERDGRAGVLAWLAERPVPHRVIERPS